MPFILRMIYRVLYLFSCYSCFLVKAGAGDLFFLIFPKSMFFSNFAMRRFIYSPFLFLTLQVNKFIELTLRDVFVYKVEALTYFSAFKKSTFLKSML